MTDKSPLPPLHEYALAHRCPACGSDPGEPCSAPRKRASSDSFNAGREEVGLSPVAPDPLQLMHARRRDAGRRHRDRDEMKAPWPSDREPGRRYDTLGRT